MNSALYIWVLKSPCIINSLSLMLFWWPLLMSRGTPLLLELFDEGRRINLYDCFFFRLQPTKACFWFYLILVCSWWCIQPFLQKDTCTHEVFLSTWQDFIPIYCGCFTTTSPSRLTSSYYIPMNGCSDWVCILLFHFASPMGCTDFPNSFGGKFIFSLGVVLVTVANLTLPS